MNAQSLPYVVFGVTGRTGAAAADALLRAGYRVRVVVRHPAKGRSWAARGAGVAVADLTDLNGVTRALTQARGAYVITPQDYGRDDLFAHADAIAATTARAAVLARVPKLVALSSVGADRAGGTGWIMMNHVFEQRLLATGIPTVFLRAAYFMENWTPMVRAAMRSGTLPTFLAPAARALPMVAAIDVGHAAAALLQEETMETGALALAGPQEYAPHDVAAILASLLGEPVGVAVLAQSMWPLALADAHFSQAALTGFTAMTRRLNDGYIDFASDLGAAARCGKTPLDRVVVRLASLR